MNDNDSQEITATNLRAKAMEAFVQWQSETNARRDQERQQRRDDLAYAILQALNLQLTPDHEGLNAEADGLIFSFQWTKEPTGSAYRNLYVRNAGSGIWYPAETLVQVGQAIEKMQEEAKP